MEFELTEENKLKIRLENVSSEQEEILYGLLPRAKKTPPLEALDFELQPLIADMWAHGYKTLTSCSGHKKRYGWLTYRPPSGKNWRTIGWTPKATIPRALAEVLRIELKIERGFGRIFQTRNRRVWVSESPTFTFKLSDDMANGLRSKYGGAAKKE